MEEFMDLSEMKEILDFMNANNLIEVEYEVNGKKIKLRKSEGIKHDTSGSVFPVIPAVSKSTGEIAEISAGKIDSNSNVIEFKAPLVGTFYMAPKPDAEPFVRVGDEITPDSVLCIIEAMKVMNEIKAEINGVIRKILVKNGQPVEFGEILFLIEKK